MLSKNKTRWMKKIGIILFWIAVWQIMTVTIGNKILMVGPLDTLEALVKNAQDADFLKIIVLSFGRIVLGSVLAIILGSILGIVAHRWKLIEEIFSPIFTLLKAIPVASFVVLLLIWWGSAYLSVAICFLIVLPNVYVNMLQGLASADCKLLEMASVFHMPLKNKIFYLYRPALKPFMDSCLKISLGMSWKSGVAAEVIGTPDFSIGEKLYISKIYLDTAGVFAWTATIIALSFLFEKLGLYIWHKFCDWQPTCHAKIQENISKREEINLSSIVKTYDGKTVLDNVSIKIKPGEIYCVMSPSGTGKTTLLQIIAGLTSTDNEDFLENISCGMVFQEERLCEEYNALQNVAFVCGSKKENEIRTQLELLLPKEAIEQPCKELSGGMKRRVSLVRAVMATNDILLLDEPFSGLDIENRKIATQYLLEHQNGRSIIIATHEETDAKFVGGKVWRLGKNE